MRYERKYKVDHLTPQLTRQVIRFHPSSFKKIFPDRQINNIYFDTPNLSTFYDNVEGVSERKKYRIRWYGNNLSQMEKPHLEIKIKENQLGRKRSFSLNDQPSVSLPLLSDIVRDVLPAVPLLKPILMNSYKRSYYGTTDGRFRITIDYDLGFHPLLAGNGFYGYQLWENGVIVELKYEEEWDTEAGRIQQYIPFRQTKSSKYVTGVLLSADG